MLPPDLKREAERAARAAGVSFGEFTRRALRAAVAGGRRGQSADSLFDFRNVFSGPTPRDLAENHDNYLYGDDD